MVRYDDVDDKKNLLPENYRRWDKPPEEFRYMIENVLQPIRPTTISFRDQKAQRPLSEIFTVSDEAFGLVILLNEYHCWAGNKREGKRFVCAKSGNPQGWTTAGINAYLTLCKNVKQRRLEESSRKLEEIIMSEYAGITGTNGRSGNDEEEVLVSDFEDDDENQRLDVVLRAQQLGSINDNNEYNNALVDEV